VTGYGFHPEASVDLDEIWEFIAIDNLDAANRVTDELIAGVELLVAFPNQGYKRPKLTSRPLRFKPVREYVIAYAPEKKPLWVVAVFHGRRNPRVIAAMLRGREEP
jgi:plasmid stabilization system protein ParE